MWAYSFSTYFFVSSTVQIKYEFLASTICVVIVISVFRLRIRHCPNDNLGGFFTCILMMVRARAYVYACDKWFGRHGQSPIKLNVLIYILCMWHRMTAATIRTCTECVLFMLTVCLTWLKNLAVLLQHSFDSKKNSFFLENHTYRSPFLVETFFFDYYILCVFFF